jgi:hypothetical protein
LAATKSKIGTANGRKITRIPGSVAVGQFALNSGPKGHSSTALGVAQGYYVGGPTGRKNTFSSNANVNVLIRKNFVSIRGSTHPVPMGTSPSQPAFPLSVPLRPPWFDLAPRQRRPQIRAAGTTTPKLGITPVARYTGFGRGDPSLGTPSVVIP